MLTPAVVHSGQADKTLQERARIMVLAYSRNPERFVHGAPVVKPFPGEVWINKPLAPDCQKPTMESKLIPLGNDTFRTECNNVINAPRQESPSTFCRRVRF